VAHFGFQRLALGSRRIPLAHEAVIGSLKRALDELSRGNLGFRIDSHFSSAYEQLRTTFNSSVDTLARWIDAVSDATGTLRHSSSDISEAMDALSQRTDQQAATIEETSAALTEIAAAVGNSSAQSAEASRMMSETSRAAAQCAGLMRDAIGAMQRIEGSSGQIGSIINVIDETSRPTCSHSMPVSRRHARATRARALPS
jgi:methyl-accepting chemotaxis protein